MSLEALRCAALADDPRAERELCSRLMALLLRFYGKRFEGQDVEDLAQATFVNVWTRLPEFEPAHDDAFRRWVLVIAAAMARNVKRGRTREARAKRRLADEPAPSAPTGPSTWVRRREFARLLDDAIERLVPKYREVVDHELDDGDARSLAALQQTAVTTARTRRRRAHLVLERYVAEAQQARAPGFAGEDGTPTPLR